MSENFIRPSNPTFDKVVEEATSGEVLGQNYEALKASLHLAMAGAQSQPEGSPIPASNGFKFEKEIRWADSVHRRPLVIRANTMEDLQALENEILYGGQQ